MSSGPLKVSPLPAPGTPRPPAAPTFKVKVISEIDTGVRLIFVQQKSLSYPRIPKNDEAVVLADQGHVVLVCFDDTADVVYNKGELFNIRMDTVIRLKRDASGNVYYEEA